MALVTFLAANYGNFWVATAILLALVILNMLTLGRRAMRSGEFSFAQFGLHFVFGIPFVVCLFAAIIGTVADILMQSA